MIKGKVKWFNSEKGFGFIYTNQLDDHFFNVKNVDGFDLPNIGDIIEFESNTGKKGLFATNIKIISSKNDDGKTECPQCKSMIRPKTVHNPRKKVSVEVDRLSNGFWEEDTIVYDTAWENAYVSGNCPLCGYEIWSN